MNTSSLIIKSAVFHRKDFSLFADIEFPEGKFSVILGPSGCGKTTLLDLAAGFITPVTGNIFEGEKNVTELPPELRNIGMIFQTPALFPNMNVLKNTAYGLIARGWKKKDAYRKAFKYLELVNMKQYAQRMPHSLSGGEKQRVSIARALCTEPALLLMDEPFSSLDAGLRHTLRNQIKNIQEITGVTTILVTHDREEALTLADFLVIMKDGRIIQSGKPADLWENPVNLFSSSFLGRTGILKICSYRDIDGNNTEITTSAGKFIINKRNFSSGKIPEQKETYAVIRPEKIRIAESQGKTYPQGVISGIVEQSEYSGSFWKVRIKPEKTTDCKSAGDILEINYSGKNPPEKGIKVFLEMDITGIRAVTD